MIVVGNTIISDDIQEKFFACDLQKCRGACCIAGDSGAPLEKDEVLLLEQSIEKIKPYLSKDSLATISQKGASVKSSQGKFLAPVTKSGKCVYAFWDKNGYLKCGIEKANENGETPLQKPLSCHLYPVRVTKFKDYDAVNYHKWKICNDACKLGEMLGIPIYKFVKKAFICKYGEEWYSSLVNQIENTRGRS